MGAYEHVPVGSLGVMLGKYDGVVVAGVDIRDTGALAVYNHKRNCIIYYHHVLYCLSYAI